MTIKNIVSRNIPFTVRIVEQGDKYGLRDCLTHNKSEPFVEFYDGRYMHTQYGQFVARYNFTTLQDFKGGLDLDGGVPDWKVDAAAMAEVKAWMAEYHAIKPVAPSKPLTIKF